MAKLGFTHNDFRVFRIEGFSARMGEIHARIRPRLLKLGDELAPELGRRLRMEFFPHVAKHARRSVNPPPETWAAFGPSPKGYKRYGYLALCVSAAGLHARAVVKPEAEGRLEMARRIEAEAAQLRRKLGFTPIARYDKWDFASLPRESHADADLFGDIGRSLKRKTTTLDLGFGWPVADAVRLDRAELIDAFSELEPLYRIVNSVVR